MYIELILAGMLETYYYLSMHHTMSKHEFPNTIYYPKPSTTYSLQK